VRLTLLLAFLTMSADVSALPHNLEAEKAVLGACLINPEAFDRVAGVVGTLDFFRDAHQRIFATFKALARRGIPIDLVPVKDELDRAGNLDRVGGPAYISGLTDGVPRSANVEYYADIVRTRARDRSALEQLRRASSFLTGGNREAARRAVQLFEEDTVISDELLLEPIGQIAQRVSSDPPRQLVDGLLPATGIALQFGQPRTFKSLALREIAVAVALGRSPFGLTRLRVDDPVPVAYVTEEDSASAILEHLEMFSAGAARRGELPVCLSACRGLTLDDPATQDRVIREAVMGGVGLIIIEPARSVTACVDQGPRELQPFAAFLRRLARETGAAIALGHHELKPLGGQDARRGAQRISGGGLFSIAEAPMHFQRLEGDRVLVTPCSWKHFEDPAAFVLRLETEGGRVRRLIGEEFAPTPPDEPRASTDRVLDWVRSHPGQSSSEIARNVGRKSATLEALGALTRAGKLRSERDGRAERWFATGDREAQ
jgi:DnaB-like helicase N terminal domain/AAA domain